MSDENKTGLLSPMRRRLLMGMAAIPALFMMGNPSLAQAPATSAINSTGSAVIDTEVTVGSHAISPTQIKDHSSMLGLDRQRAAGKEGTTGLVADVFTSFARPMKGPPGATFSPTTATLVSGKHDCVLIDTLMAVEDVDALADAIERTGKVLTRIVITHGHPDHYFGAGRLLDRFPSAEISAASGVVDYIRDNKDAELALFNQIMDFDLAKPTAIPRALASNVLDLEGQELRVINVGQGDIAPSTVIWIPSLETVIAGDVAYNSMHLMLGLSGPEEWNRWIDSINTIRALNPSTVIAGHKNPSANNDAKAILDGTEAYIRNFSNVSTHAATSQEIVAEMSKRYPDYPNISILHLSAEAAAKRNGR